MQVSTSGFYDRAAQTMGRLQAKANELQARGDGKRLHAPSDDAVAYRKLQGLAQAKADDKIDGANLKVAGSVLAQADSVLSSVTDQLQHASELALRASNGTMSAQDRRVIGIEVESILQSLVQLANSTDPRGEPLFGGADGGAGAVRQPDGSYALASTRPSAIPIGEGEAMEANEPASRVFGFTGAAGPTDALAVLAALAEALRANDAAGIATGVGDLKLAGDQVGAAQASLGARAARIDLAEAQLERAATDREAARSGLEDADIVATATELQKTLTILAVTQASFGKMSSMSLFDYLR